MKKKLLIIMLCASGAMSAQTTHVISWFMGVTSTQASKTINTGDTVTWTWDDTLPHTVTSIGGGAESFNSGQLTGSNQQYSRVFNVVGSTNYRCSIHAMMQGTITTQSVMGTEDVTEIGFTIFPNPVTDILTINSKSVIDNIEVFDMNGRLITRAAAGNQTVKIYMDNYRAGTYIVKAIAGTLAETITVVKK